MATATLPAELLSLGFLCSVVSMSPATIKRRLEALGIEPATTINGVAHYTGDVVELLQSSERNHEPR